MFIKNVDIIDFMKSREKWEKKEKRKAWLFKEYREQYCLDEVKGYRAIQDIDRMKRLVEEWKDREKKDKDPVYKAARSLKKLKFNELKELISNSIEGDGYSDLQFQTPEMVKNVIVAFTASDTKNNRH